VRAWWSEIAFELLGHRTFVVVDGVSRRLPSVVPELANQCIIVNGVAKAYAMTGWRVGWMIVPVTR
jgi:aspartate/methionine/tyrosine aminotransferase